MPDMTRLHLPGDDPLLAIGKLMGPVEALGTLREPWGCSLGALGGSWAALRRPLGCLGRPWAPLEALGRPWGGLGDSPTLNNVI